MNKMNIKYQLMNFEKNKGLLEALPHVRYLDLAIVFYSEIEEEEGCPFGLLTWKGLEALGIGVEEVEALAAQNTPRQMPCCLESLESLVKGFLGEHHEEEEGKLPMYVLTNRRRMFGAACILYPGLLERISSTLDSDLYILPSSIHECILVPVGKGSSKEEFQEIVREVNASQVPEEEILSDAVYVYHREEDSITL